MRSHFSFFLDTAADIGDKGFVTGMLEDSSLAELAFGPLVCPEFDVRESTEQLLQTAFDENSKVNAVIEYSGMYKRSFFTGVLNTIGVALQMPFELLIDSFTPLFFWLEKLLPLVLDVELQDLQSTPSTDQSATIFGDGDTAVLGDREKPFPVAFLGSVWQLIRHFFKDSIIDKPNGKGNNVPSFYTMPNILELRSLELFSAWWKIVVKLNISAKSMVSECVSDDAVCDAFIAWRHKPNVALSRRWVECVTLMVSSLHTLGVAVPDAVANTCKWMISSNKVSEQLPSVSLTDAQKLELSRYLPNTVGNLGKPWFADLPTSRQANFSATSRTRDDAVIVVDDSEEELAIPFPTAEKRKAQVTPSPVKYMPFYATAPPESKQEPKRVELHPVAELRRPKEKVVTSITPPKQVSKPAWEPASTLPSVAAVAAVPKPAKQQQSLHLVKPGSSVSTSAGLNAKSMPENADFDVIDTEKTLFKLSRGLGIGKPSRKAQMLHDEGTSLLETDKRFAEKKARLKRAAEAPRVTLQPSVDPLLRNVLAWNIFELHKLSLLKDTTAVPNAFKDVEEYRRTWQPLLLEECRAKLQQCRTEVEVKPVKLKIVSSSKVNDFHSLTLAKTDESTSYNKPHQPMSESTNKKDFNDPAFYSTNDLILLSRGKIDDLNLPSAPNVHFFLAVVEKDILPGRRGNDMNVDDQSNDAVALRNGAVKVRCFFNPSDVRSRAAWNNASIGSEWFAVKIDNMVTVQREYQTLFTVELSPLLDQILKPSRLAHAQKRKLTTEDIVPSFPSSFQTLFRKLKETLNESQFDSVVKASSHLCSSESASTSTAPNAEFVLLQGPPGTGKTHVIQAMLSVFLLSTLPASKTSSGASGTSSSSSSASKLHREPSNTSAAKILVCAPSNAAVDEIVLRLAKTGVWDQSGNFVKPRVVRFGGGQVDASMNQYVKQYTLESLVAERVAQRTTDSATREVQPTDVKQKLESIRADLDKFDSKMSEIRAEIAQLESEERQYEMVKFAEATISNELEAGKPDSDKPKAPSPLEQLASQRQTRLQALEQEEWKLRSAKSTRAKALYATKAQAREVYANVEQVKNNVRNSILCEADIICTTLSSSSHESISTLVQSGRMKFSHLIIDEAAQSVELSTLIPLRYGVRHVVLVGDPQQLPATVFSKSNLLYERSIFQRFMQEGVSVPLLSIQYRMHPEIRRFPSHHFYQDRLQDAPSVTHRPQWALPQALREYMFLDVSEGQHGREERTSSLANRDEAQFIAELYRRLRDSSQALSLEGQVAIISPYKQQVRTLRRHLKTALHWNDARLNRSIEINTVDGFQGREKEIVIFSCVRASPPSERNGVGFLADIRRMNVGLTRAKQALWIVGHAQSLQSNPDWKALLDNAKARERFRAVKKPFAKALQVLLPESSTTTGLPPAATVASPSPTPSQQQPSSQERQSRKRKLSADAKTGSSTSSNRPDNAAAKKSKQSPVPSEKPPPQISNAPKVLAPSSQPSPKRTLSSAVVVRDSLPVPTPDAVPRKKSSLAPSNVPFAKTQRYVRFDADPLADAATPTAKQSAHAATVPAPKPSSSLTPGQSKPQRPSVPPISSKPAALMSSSRPSAPKPSVSMFQPKSVARQHIASANRPISNTGRAVAERLGQGDSTRQQRPSMSGVAGPGTSHTPRPAGATVSSVSAQKRETESSELSAARKRRRLEVAKPNPP
eukprot:GILJ01013141.1.p1 GENE.GILJ01013141.1~~GILJ01013141.1.p1  ORF type:complete len:1814 (+),score=235.23 GILJ01013141.1:329-5443(+)